MLMVTVVRQMVLGCSKYVDGYCGKTLCYSGVLRMLMVTVVRHMLLGCSKYVDGYCGKTYVTRVF